MLSTILIQVKCNMKKTWAKTNENEIKIYKNQIQLLDIYITLLPDGCILCQAKWLYSF